jgi:hypothetical protein
MSEKEVQGEVPEEVQGDIPVPPDRSLTLKPARLAGSPHCLNCGTELKGPFCYYCGQPDRNFFRFFPALLREFMSDFLELDSRFMRTMKPLMFRPGRLTRDYLEGRRFRYTPPLRLYLFSSIVFFLLAALLSSNAIDGGNHEVGVITITPDREEQLQQARDAIDNMPEEAKEQLGLDPEVLKQQIDKATSEQQEETEVGKPEENWFDSSDIQFNDEPWDRETNPVDIRWLPDSFNDWINDEVENSPDKARRINENPDLIIDQVFDILPATMFVLLPVVALLFKFWFLFAKRYYVEHLIFALHNHSFLFVSLTLLLLIAIIEGRLTEAGMTGTGQAVSWLAIALMVWVPMYMLISLRHVYRQNWFLTFIKFGVIGLSYVSLLALVTSIVAVLAFVLL